MKQDNILILEIYMLKNQNVYDDPVTRFQKNVQEKVDERIRAEEHLRRIRGY